jgi:ubiquinone/menaquinone biosynthesis C-methylase UbiE
MEAARRRGWEATGVDVSKDAVQSCRNRGLNCVTIHGVHLPFADASFDVLTAWHVIEHVGDVRETLAEWRRVLCPGGVMALETPDGSSPKVRRRGANYAKFWKIEHTYVFAPWNLAQLVEETGFERVSLPAFGRFRDFTPAQACYALAHCAVDFLLRRTGNHKAFQLCARRVETGFATLASRRAA